VPDATGPGLHQHHLAITGAGTLAQGFPCSVVTNGAAAASTNESRLGLCANKRSSTTLTSWYVPGVGPKPPWQK